VEAFKGVLAVTEELLLVGVVEQLESVSSSDVSSSDASKAFFFWAINLIFLSRSSALLVINSSL